MPSFQFSDSPATRHHVYLDKDGVRVDGALQQVRPAGAGCFVTRIDGRSQHLHAVADGDTVHVQFQGRAWRIDRVDPARSVQRAGAGGAGASHAPMPGVVVALLAAVGQQVTPHEALLVIESMKLQMTISATVGGAVAELPLAVGQTFQRGDLLARVQPSDDVVAPAGTEVAA